MSAGLGASGAAAAAAACPACQALLCPRIIEPDRALSSSRCCSSSPTSGVRLTGVCQSTDANEIKACLWSPTHAAVKNRIYF